MKMKGAQSDIVHVQTAGYKDATEG